jgi:hypothetical protein
LIREGASLGIAAAGALAIIAGIIVGLRRRRGDAPPGGRFAVGVLLAGPFVLVAGQYFSLANGKPGEYGRFALYLDAVLAIAAMSGVAWWVRDRVIAGVIVAGLLVAVAVPGMNYVLTFVHDANGRSTRWTAAAAIERLTKDHPCTIALLAEPAPYSAPPMDLFRNRIVLLPMGGVPDAEMADIVVRAVDDPQGEAWWEQSFEAYRIVDRTPARISWANKPFVIDVAPLGRK